MQFCRCTDDITELRESEQQKVRCGTSHFDELGVDFKMVKSAEDLRLE